MVHVKTVSTFHLPALEALWGNVFESHSPITPCGRGPQWRTLVQGVGCSVSLPSMRRSSSVTSFCSTDILCPGLRLHGPGWEE